MLPLASQRWTWEVFNHHPPYSPNLAPSDFYLFLHLKKLLSIQPQRFQNEREKNVSVTVVPIPDGRFPRQLIQKLVPQYGKCLNSGGEYYQNSSTPAVSVTINLSIK